MVLGLTPFVALSCYLVYRDWVIPGAIIFVATTIFGNWFIWKTELRRTTGDKAAK